MAISSNDKSSLLYKNFLGTGSTRVNREYFEEAIKSSQVVQPKDIWAYGEEIPDGTEETGGESAIAQIKALRLESSGDKDTYTWEKSESEKEVELVKCWRNLLLTKVDSGTNTSFLLRNPATNDQIRNIIPFNFYEDVYNYSLTTSTGETIPFGVGDWMVDTYAGILTFYGDVPEGVDSENPPKLTFYQYVGGNGFRDDETNYEVAVLPINNFHIGPDTVTFSDTNESDATKTLHDVINTQVEKIEPGFLATYGWDGDDDNEGIALKWERVMPLTYTSSRDPVKGYDNSTSSQIGVILSSKTTNLEKNDYFEIIYVSQNLKEGAYTLELTNDSLQVVQSSSVEEDSLITTRASVNKQTLYEGKIEKLTLDTKDFLYVRIKSLPETFNESFYVSEDTNKITAALVYWDSSVKDWLPFISKEDDYFDFGFPVVTLQGKIKVSMKLDTASLSSFDDVITPEYYGPRVATYVFAVEGGHNIKSSDYVVKNTSGWYFNDLYTKAKADYEALHPGKKLTGTILLREGTYKISDSFSIEDNVIFETEGNVSFEFTSDDAILTLTGSVVLKNTSISRAATISIEGDSCFLVNVSSKDSNVIVTSTSSSIIKNCSFKSINVLDSNSHSKFSVILDGNFLESVKVERDNTVTKNNTIGSFEIPLETESITVNNYIGEFKNFNSKGYIHGNYISTYTTPESQTITPIGTDKTNTSGRFPIFDKNNFKVQKYAEFSFPFSYNDKTDSIELLYDSDTLTILEDGKLKVIANSGNIHMNDSTFELNDAATDSTVDQKLPNKTYTSENTLNDIFKDLWKEKADLNANGKIPLQELPDSVAYGGLLYVGSWSFDAHDRKYPTFDDVKDKVVGLDPVIDDLQPGWFVIVEAKEVDDNPVLSQTAEDNQVYTAGDWAIFSGKTSDGNYKWDKLDRAYSDPVFSLLPSVAKISSSTTNPPWYWKKDIKNGGALDFSESNTLVDAIYKVNMQLRKLEPKKPLSISNKKFKTNSSELPIVEVRSSSTKSPLTLIDGKACTENNLNIEYTFNNENDYSDYIYVGDSSRLSLSLDETFADSNTPAQPTKSESFTLPNGVPEVEEGDFYIVNPLEETMLSKDHGLGFWKGLKFSMFRPISCENGQSKLYKFSSSISNTKVSYLENNLRNYTDYPEYNGKNSISSEVITRPYCPTGDIQASWISKDTSSYKNSGHFVSGVWCMDSSKFDIGLSDLKIFDVYNKYIGKDKIAEMTVFLNRKGKDTEEITSSYDISDYCSIVSFEGKPNEGITVDSENSKIHFTDVSVISDTYDTINFKFVVYDAYNEPHNVVFKEGEDDLSLLRFDTTFETERLLSGSVLSDSEFYSVVDNESSFGKEYNSEVPCYHEKAGKYALQKGGRRLEDGSIVSEYFWPYGEYDNTLGRFSTEFSNINYTAYFLGETDSDGTSWASACFSFIKGGAFLKEASGFSMTLHVEDDIVPILKEKHNFLTGETSGIKIQCCVVKDGKKVTSWFDCNKAYDGYGIPEGFNYPVMYAGQSDYLHKRVTFGRTTFTGDLYIRVGIEKDSKIRFTKVTIDEVI